jgi:hypothetical protein
MGKSRIRVRQSSYKTQVLNKAYKYDICVYVLYIIVYMRYYVFCGIRKVLYYRLFYLKNAL